jgi:hypothetical protein
MFVFKSACRFLQIPHIRTADCGTNDADYLGYNNQPEDGDDLDIQGDPTGSRVPKGKNPKRVRELIWVRRHQAASDLGIFEEAAPNCFDIPLFCNELVANNTSQVPVHAQKRPASPVEPWATKRQRLSSTLLSMNVYDRKRWAYLSRTGSISRPNRDERDAEEEARYAEEDVDWGTKSEEDSTVDEEEETDAEEEEEEQEMAVEKEEETDAEEEEEEEEMAVEAAQKDVKRDNAGIAEAGTPQTPFPVPPATSPTCKGCKYESSPEKERGRGRPPKHIAPCPLALDRPLPYRKRGRAALPPRASRLVSVN